MNYEELLTDMVKKYPDHVKNARVLELFSLSNSGPYVRSFFTDCTHVGIDTVVGSGVDVKSKILGDVDLSSLAKFDTLVSCQRLDEDPHWEKDLKKLSKFVKPGGIIVLEWARSDDGPDRDAVVKVLKISGFHLTSGDESDEDDDNWTVVAQSTIPNRKVEKVKTETEEEKGG